MSNSVPQRRDKGNIPQRINLQYTSCSITDSYTHCIDNRELAVFSLCNCVYLMVLDTAIGGVPHHETKENNSVSRTRGGIK